MAAGCMSSNSKGVKEKPGKGRQGSRARGPGRSPRRRLHEALLRRPARRRSTRTAPSTRKSPPKTPPSIVGTLKGGKTDVAQGDPNHPFFTKQLSIVLANSGVVDPERIESYIAADGYQALHDVLREMTPKEVVDAMIKSGLRGRGGAGYPTGLKWATVAKTQSAQKYVICNADEGDPGAFMDRSVLESDPHSVLEGMAIAAYAVGADQGFIYVRAEYPLAITPPADRHQTGQATRPAGQRHL